MTENQETYTEKVERVIKDCVYSSDDGKSRILWKESVALTDVDTIKDIESILCLVNEKPELQDLEVSELIKIVQNHK